LILRPYQLQAVEQVLALRHERPVLCQPTGSGKTVVLCELIRRHHGPALVLAHRRELIHQARARLAQHGIHAGLILAGEPRSALPVQVASIQTLARREYPLASLVIVDEAHHAVSQSYQAALGHYAARGAWIVGATATPFRLDGRGLSPTFTAIVAPVTVRDLVEQGSLLDPTVYAPQQPDLKGVATKAGDFDQQQIGERMSSLTGNILEHWLALARERRTVVFACNVAHSQALRDRFSAAGIPTAHLDGTTSTTDRDGVLSDLRDGRIQVVTNCAILSEGWDLPALDCAVLARPTKSLCVHVQQVGRILRPAEGKTSALVLDHAGNHYRHGLISDPIEYSLDAPVKKQREARSYRQCLACYAIIPLGPSACPQCGDVRISEPAVPSEQQGTLAKFVPPSREDKETEYRRLVLIANERRYRLGWAKQQYRAKFNVWPVGFKHIDALYECTLHVSHYVQNLGYRCARCLRPCGIGNATDQAAARISR
jgi:DNA repair protein RadD